MYHQTPLHLFQTANTFTVSVGTLLTTIAYRIDDNSVELEAADCLDVFAGSS